jgi:hypothetical protein
MQTCNLPNIFRLEVTILLPSKGVVSLIYYGARMAVQFQQCLIDGSNFYNSLEILGLDQIVNRTALAYT